MASGPARWLDLIRVVDRRDGLLLNALTHAWFRRVRAGLWGLTRAGRKALKERT
jgi:hypothetical protein